MAPTGTLRPRERFFGRGAELAALGAVLGADGPEVVALWGLPGIGKSAMLRALARQGNAERTVVFVLDCRTVEPTERAFRLALNAAGCAETGDSERVLCLDHYDHFQLLDAWLRRDFLAQAGPGLRLVLAGRHAPGVGWAAAGLRMRDLRLDVLDEHASQALLESYGMRGDAAARAQRLAKGHPLALVLAASASGEGPGEGLAALALPDILHRLTRYFLEHVDDARLREALEAASSVRRVTRPILAALLDTREDARLFDALADTPLSEARSDGLSLHPTVHEAVAGWLRAADPARFTLYRRRAWTSLQRAGRTIGAQDLWRYTADVIFLIDDPVVREAFFPSGVQVHAVEAARVADHGAIRAIARTHDGPEGEALIEHWLTEAPRAVHVVRDAAGVVEGFYLLFDPADVTEAALREDPMTRAWWADLPAALKAGHRRVLFLRRWLARTAGDIPSPVQAACWLDVKRAYLEARPLLRRVYLAVGDLAPYAEAAVRLGFRPVCGDGDLPLASAMLDFGSGSVDAWLGRLVRGSLGIREEIALDVAARSLRVGEAVISLTPRELDVVRLLWADRGDAVSREELLRQAWEGGYSVGSNVVDVLIRGLRRKLGPRAGAIETVRGVGYRWTG